MIFVIAAEMKVTLGLLIVVHFFVSQAEARSFRVGLIPNGNVLRCANCHVNPAGAGTRTPFGNDVRAAIIAGGNAASANVPFWGPELAALDSDDDGLTNGQELGDPEGSGTPVFGAVVTNPGNQPPVFVNTPHDSATVGIEYLFELIASDAESNETVFSKTAGPEWIVVEPNGVVSGTPPDDSTGVFDFGVEVRDIASAGKGFSNQSSSLAVALDVRSSYEGWRRLRFDLPDEEAISGPFADASGDGNPNLLAYAIKASPKDFLVATAESRVSEDGRLVIRSKVRNDDPDLRVSLETTDDLDFSDAVVVSGITVEEGENGLDLLEFIDVEENAGNKRRFGRLRFLLSE